MDQIEKELAEQLKFLDYQIDSLGGPYGISR